MASANDNSTKQVSSKRVPTTVRDFFFDDPHFQENWEHFDKVKDAMFQESRDLWSKMDKDFRNMRCMKDNILMDKNTEPSMPVVPSGKEDPLARYESGWMFPRRWMLPSLKAELGDMDLFSPDHDHEVIRVKDDDQKLEVSLDTSHYRPDELHVYVHDGKVTIEGKHEERSKDGKHTISRHFKRRYQLPEGTREDNVSSNLSSDGVLVVSALKFDPVREVEIKQVK
eukprot:TRINITY_DN948_c0_g1_i2.p1 TRINITY_DN948_c0_g1~~TRINITY_DN948_c0_g1_i2.p1  ORF type:complete len:236 (-),score=63.09 TRINITY_DN948_c0_g1_i2:156-833(-)